MRKEVQLFDQVSWREAVINAFIHNQWTSGMGPAFTAYSDRIEILSRGTFAPGQTVEGFFAGESVPVNGALADMVRKLHSFEQFGRGVPQIVERYGRKAIGIHETSIRVTLPYERVPLPEVSRPSESVRDERAALSKNRSKMLAAMRDNPTITQVELGTALSLSKTAVYNNVTWLKKHGCIERVGSKKAGWWRVL